MSYADSTKNGSNPDIMTDRYPVESILSFERIFGHGWISTGGEETTKEFLLKLNLRPGLKVLDIGSGTGGTAFYLAGQYGVRVYGVDYCKHMVDFASERLSKDNERLSNLVDFAQGNILNTEFPRNSFDVIFSKDVILLIKEKRTLFSKIKSWLKPGGKLFIIDYCRGEAESYQDFEDFVNKYEYHLVPLQDYKRMIQDIGFNVMEATDVSDVFLEQVRKELKSYIDAKEDTIQLYGKDSYEAMLTRWERKIKHSASKAMAWGQILATH